MTYLIGEYECKIDPKGRVMIPVGLKKQLPSDEQGRFILNRGFEQCLALYPYKVWLQIAERVKGLNMYVKENREFARYFLRGATEIQLDSSGRMLISKSLLEYAKIDSELVITGLMDHMEIWSPANYNLSIDSTNEPADFAALAEKVMGGINSGGGEFNGIS
ncbi:division/cell wall cluster transcriptional repressor MraZ [Solitalea koreensis]|uniref:Transcriptional regulator MraZ n=1 Tax=Solitalea koreensis TaxID=543615 RepID=A0A521E5R5_9SPHI|nr:division/cell wall cluster transcriptional repressor MraZ [Solitalea koreensis]SMO78500.1 MraZ protein [Solitalea koreensis]